MKDKYSLVRTQIQTLRTMFQQIDSQNKGFISLQDLNSIDKFKLSEIESAVESMLLWQLDQNDQIDFNRFRQIIAEVQRKQEKPPTNKQLLYAFQQFDADGNHLISFKEFWREVRSLDGSISRREAEAIFSDMDQDKNGCIDFREFVSYLEAP